jgi:hypothetical protein
VSEPVLTVHKGVSEMSPSGTWGGRADHRIARAFWDTRLGRCASTAIALYSDDGPSDGHSGGAVRRTAAAAETTVFGRGVLCWVLVRIGSHASGAEVSVRSVW